MTQPRLYQDRSQVSGFVNPFVVVCSLSSCQWQLGLGDWKERLRDKDENGLVPLNPQKVTHFMLT